MAIFGSVYIIVIIVSAVAIVFEVPEYANIKEPVLFKAVVSFVQKTFRGRNIFGCILSFIFTVMIFPSIVLVLGIQLLIYILRVLCCIWQLGDRRDGHENHKKRDISRDDEL